MKTEIQWKDVALCIRETPQWFNKSLIKYANSGTNAYRLFKQQCFYGLNGDRIHTTQRHIEFFRIYGYSARRGMYCTSLTVKNCITDEYLFWRNIGYILPEDFITLVYPDDVLVYSKISGNNLELPKQYECLLLLDSL